MAIYPHCPDDLKFCVAMPEVMMYQVMAPDWPVFSAASSSNLQEKNTLTKTTEQKTENKA
jgi:hypothetical protein